MVSRVTSGDSQLFWGGALTIPYDKTGTRECHQKSHETQKRGSAKLKTSIHVHRASPKFSLQVKFGEPRKKDALRSGRCGQARGAPMLLAACCLLLAACCSIMVDRSLSLLADPLVPRRLFGSLMEPTVELFMLCPARRWHEKQETKKAIIQEFF